MYKKKLTGFVLLFIFLLPILGGCTDPSNHYNPKAENGMLDLSLFQFENNVIRLDGQWEFYWGQLLEPGVITDSGRKTGYIDVPCSWNQYRASSKEKTGDGCATYRLFFRTEDGIKLGLKIPRLFTAYKLWLNNELIASAGTVGQTKDTMVPQYLPKVALFEAHKGENEIVIQVSNFYHRSGGILESIILGTQQNVLRLRDNSIAFELFLFGGLFISGTYHLALFFLRKKNRAPLYFGTFCLLVGIRTLLVGERFLISIFPDFSWEVAHKIQTLTFYLGVPIILMFFMSVFPKYFHAGITRIVQLLALVFASLVLFTPAKIFSVINPLYQIFTVMVILYILKAFITLSLRKEQGGLLIIVGALALILTSLNDIIFLSIWSNSAPLFKAPFKTGNLSSVGQIIFAATNSLLLARILTSAFEREEVMTARLKEINHDLDGLVVQRTKALEESKKKIECQKIELEKANRELQLLSLKDPLTGIWNRRKYNDAIQEEWRRCLRYKRPIALLILDIDHYKSYNDFYGHMAGDECLVKLAKTIKASFCRSSDLVARYGGEEFVVILPETGKDKALYAADMLRKRIEALQIPHCRSPVSTFITVSVGVASRVPDSHGSPEKLFEIVDKALYQAKAAGRNQVRFLSE